jgi:hypothetical protein
VGGKLHLMLRMNSRPIAHKYHEGKMKRTLERELKVTELAGREADGSSEAEHSNHTLLFGKACQCKWHSFAQGVKCGVTGFACQVATSCQKWHCNLHPSLWKGLDLQQ